MPTEKVLLGKIRAWAIIVSPLFFYLIVLVLNKLGIGSLCIWKALTGHQCLGCGTTRALYSLCHGEFKIAYEYNHLIVITAPLLIYLWGKYSLAAIRELSKGKVKI